MDVSCTLFSVQYQDNGADNPNGMGTTNASTGEKSVKQINIAEDTQITLLSPNFKKAGYAFLGWSLDSQAYAHFTDNDNTNDPVIYGPMEDVVIDADIIATANNRNQINMYAVWIPALKDGSNNTVYMQEWDNTATTLPHDGCSTLTATVFDDTITDEKGKIIVTKNSVVALTDKRDNEVYTVARLADGNCWMTENLRLEHDGTVGNNINDSNVTNQSLSQGYGGTTGTYGNFVGLANPESANFTNSTTANSIYKSDGSNDTYNLANNTLEDIGTEISSYRFPRYNNSNTQSLADSIAYTQNYTNPSNPSDSGTNYRTSSNLYSYGNYYTWSAAMASTRQYDFPSDAEAAGTSICPSGWYLPSYSRGQAKEYGTLSISYGGVSDEIQNGVIGNRYRSFPNNFLLSGQFYNSSYNNSRGLSGYYWSRSASNSNSPSVSSNNLQLYRFNITLNNSAKYNGYSVRCLAGASNVEIILDSNNGTGAITRLYGAPESSIGLSKTSIAQSGYGFKNWNTAPDGSGTTYTSSFTIPAGSIGEILYAQWNPQYRITYVNNCISWASSDTNCTQASSDSTSTQDINLDSSGNGSGNLGDYDEFRLTGWKIKEWTTNANGTGTVYPISSTYSVTGANAGDGITLYAHWVRRYSIQYDGNGADNPNGMGTTYASTGVKSVKQINVVQGQQVTLLASNFKRAGYGFAGWSTNQNATVSSGDKIYGPMETIDAPAPPANGNIITMYAVWVEAKKGSNNKPVYLQDFTSSDCNALTKADFDSSTGVITPGSVIALTDKRDNMVYAVAKLADGKCWMIENLRLDNQYTMGQNQNDSSVTNQSLAQGYGGTTGVYGNFVGLPNSESTHYSETTTSNTVYKSSLASPTDTYDPVNNVLEDIGSSDWPSYRFPRYNNNNTLDPIDSTTYTQNYVYTSGPTDSGTNYRTASNIYSYGNYYSWAAAIANTNFYTNPSASEAANTSICPSNWHLPSSSGSTKEFGTLSRSYGGSGGNQSGNNGSIVSSRFRTFPNNFLYHGYIMGSSVYSRGTIGRYWSASAYDSGNGDSYGMSLGTSSASMSKNEYKYEGFSIRCLIGS